MFADAQRRFQLTGTWRRDSKQNAVHSYLEDVHRTYGMLKDAPDRSSTEASASQMWHHQQGISRENSTLKHQVEKLTSIVAHQSKKISMYKNMYVLDCDSGRSCVGDDSGDGCGVLPSVQSDTQAREEELKLSNAQQSKTDERSNASGGGSGGLPALPEDVPSESVGEGEREAAGAERSDPAADLGGQTGEHCTEE